MRTRMVPKHKLNTRVLIVGEAPRWEEVQDQTPYCDNVGKELFRLLLDAPLDEAVCSYTYVSKFNTTNDYMPRLFSKITPKNLEPGDDLRSGLEELWGEIEALKPDVIIGFDEATLFMLTGERNIRKWRGSQMKIINPETGNVFKFLPTYSPYTLQREWELRPIILTDIRRAMRALDDETCFDVPAYNFILRPSFQDVVSVINRLSERADNGPLKLALDIETRLGHIACVGFAWSRLEAICIPFMCVESHEGYWSESEEFALISLCTKLFKHPNVQLILQNGLYDFQYFFHRWLALFSIYRDTMITQHVLFVEMPKGLDFLSSLYCTYHHYWKDEGKEWHPGLDEEQLWSYNCKDAVATYEVESVQSKAFTYPQLIQVLEYQHKKFPVVLKIMLRGCAIDTKQKTDMLSYVLEESERRQKAIEAIIGQPLNISSPKQMQEFFYGFLKVKPVKNRQGRPTCDDKALTVIAKREPLAAPIITMIKEARSLGVMMRNFIKMKLGEDDRARSSYNIAGTVTYRWSSSKDAFGSGGNLQNIPAMDEDEDSIFPKIRCMFVPNFGYVIFDIDLDRADAQVVAWEADDEELKALFRAGADLHLQNARDIFGDPRITKSDKRRQLAKLGVHATNYGAHPPTLARSLGITTREAHDFQRRWFKLHPGIKAWHDRIENEIQTSRCITNKFGYRRHFFGRIADLLPEALAWIPQSTVGNVIDFGLMQIEERGLAEVLLQVHDSGVMQCPEHKFVGRLPAIREAMLIPIPYDDPLTIPVGIKASRRSWGDCKDIDWNFKGRLAS